VSRMLLEYGFRKGQALHSSKRKSCIRATYLRESGGVPDKCASFCGCFRAFFGMILPMVSSILGVFHAQITQKKKYFFRILSEVLDKVCEKIVF